jgi:hypothetical protein
MAETPVEENLEDQIPIVTGNESAEEGKPQSPPEAVNETIAGESTSQHFPEDSHATQPPTLNPEPQTTDMEVDHHSHAQGKKNWKSYFWEFLMLFLAVTAGFFAENLRDSLIKSGHEKDLMHSLFEDLKADTTRINSSKKEREQKNLRCDSLISLLTGTSGQSHNNLIYFYGRSASRRVHFHPQDGTLQQLENTGGLGEIDDQQLLDSINSYQLLLKFNEENIGVEEKELTEYSDAAANIFDVKVFQQMLIGDERGINGANPALMTTDPKLINILCIKLHYWKRTSLTILSSFERIKENAKNLITLIREKYHFDKNK